MSLSNWTEIDPNNKKRIAGVVTGLSDDERGAAYSRHRGSRRYGGGHDSVADYLVWGGLLHSYIGISAERAVLKTPLLTVLRKRAKAMAERWRQVLWILRVTLGMSRESVVVIKNDRICIVPVMPGYVGGLKQAPIRSVLAALWRGK